MKNKSKINSSPSTWRELLPNSSKKPASRTARLKRNYQWMKTALILFTVGIFGVGVWWMNQIDISEEFFSENQLDPSISNVTFHSDGVLDHIWFKNWFGPLRGRSLMQIDIEELHRELEKEPQIAYCQVSRIFPSTLQVKIIEKTPILVLRLGKAGGGFKDWLVSADGDIYLGTGYSKSTISLLPSLAISPKKLKLDPNGNGYRRLEEISAITPLLELARREYPSIYRDWKVVSYSNPTKSGPGSYVKILSGKVKTLRFSPQNYAAQMKRLKYLLLEPDFRRKKVVESIDLSHDRSVFAKL